MNLKVLRIHLPIIATLALCAFLRFFWLDKVPNAIGGDELTYVMTAKSVFLSGTDISGLWNPFIAFLFKYPAYTMPQAELPYLILAPIVGPFPFSLFASRFLFAVVSILTVFLIYLITKELFDREVGVVAAIVATINPWLIYIGRTSYEATPTIFFFLLAFLILLKAKGAKILWSVPFLFAAFYSYIGTKLIFVPFVFIVCVYCYFVVNKKKYLREYLIVFFTSLLLVLFFVSTIIFASPGQSRIGELFLPNNPELTKQVDEIRKVSIQTPITNIFENKITIYLRILITKLFKSFSWDYLFISGDNFYSILRHGMFYILDAFFILIGLAQIYQGRKARFWFLLSLIFISVLPQLFHTADISNFVYHLSLMFPFFAIIIAVGIWQIVGLYKNKTYFYVSSAVLFILYLFLVINFLNIYFFQWTLRGNFDFPVRVFSKYLHLSAQQKTSIDIYSPSAPDIFKKYLFYSNEYNKNTVDEVRDIYKNNKFVYKNINFFGCDKTIDPTKSKNVIIYDFNCGTLKKEYQHKSISRLYDGGQNYEIYNDNVCLKFFLKSYPSNIKISDFSIENMNVETFCKKYISKY